MAGSLEIPRNDDWSYRRIALELARSGRLTLDGASQTMIVGQILFVQPFLWLSALEPWAFGAAGIIFAIGAMVSAYVMVRQVLPARLAAIPVLLLVLFPGYLAYATSFMSDVPALAAAFACLALGAMALQRRPVPTSLLVAAVIVGFFAFSIRDFAVAAPMSVVLAALCAEPHRRRHWAIALLIAAACIGLYLWRSTLSGQLGDVTPPRFSATNLIYALSSVALVMTPVAILAAARWRHHWHRFDVIAGVEVGLLIVLLRAIQWFVMGRMPPIFLVDLASPAGVPASGYVVGGRPLLFPEPVWMAVNLIALGATVLFLAVGAGIAGHYLRGPRMTLRGRIKALGSAQGVLLLFIVVTAGGLALFAFRYNFYDRYLWTIIPPLAALILYLPADLRTEAVEVTAARRHRAAWATATVAGCVLAGMAITYLFNSHAFDVGRWRAGQALVRAGVPADAIDAGYEWMGYFSTTQPNVADPAPGPTFYRGWWPEFRLCGLVSSDPTTPDGARLIDQVPYELNLFAGPTQTLFVYRVSGPPCASAAID